MKLIVCFEVLPIFDQNTRTPYDAQLPVYIKAADLIFQTRAKLKATPIHP